MNDTLVLLILKKCQNYFMGKDLEEDAEAVSAAMARD